MPAIDVIQLRRGTAANWTSVNPILAAGEPGLETDTGKIKFGDGATHWTSLPYGPGLPASVVTVSSGSPMAGQVPVFTGTGNATTPGAGGGGAPTIVAAGNLGATHTLTVSAEETWMTGTLNANCALTIAGLSAGEKVVLLLTQDGTGGRTLSINSTSVPIPSAASTAMVLQCDYDGTNLYVSPPAVGGIPDSRGTTNGDMLVFDFDTLTFERLPVGPDGDVLTADSTQDLGVKWAAPSGGGSLTPWETLIIPTAQLPFAQSGGSGWGVYINNSTPLGAGYQNGNADQNAYVRWNVLLGAGTWTFLLTHDEQSSNGIYTLNFNTVSQGTIDGYSAGGANGVQSAITGIVVAADAVILVELKMATKNGSSGGYRGRIVALEFQRTA